MFDNIHYSYSLLLSDYALAVLLVGLLTSLYSRQIASAMKLIGLLGLLGFNISATYFAYAGLPRTVALSLDTLRLLRILLLCWLTWGILSFSADMLRVRWRHLRRAAAIYAAGASIVYLLSFSLWQGWFSTATNPRLLAAGQARVEMAEIIIYLLLGLCSLASPALCLHYGIRNTLGQRPIRHWYKETAPTLLICAVCQLLAFLPLYLAYFPNPFDLRDYIEARALDSSQQNPPGIINIMPLYYFFFSLPFFCHCLYVLWSHATTNPTTSPSTSPPPKPLTTTPPNPTASPPPKTAGIADEQHLGQFAAHYTISKREQQVLKQLIQGHSYAAIAEHLYISLATVKSHIYSIYRKTGVRSKIQLVAKILGQ